MIVLNRFNEYLVKAYSWPNLLPIDLVQIISPGNIDILVLYVKLKMWFFGRITYRETMDNRKKNSVQYSNKILYYWIIDFSILLQTDLKMGSFLALHNWDLFASMYCVHFPLIKFSNIDKPMTPFAISCELYEICFENAKYNTNCEE